MQRAGIKWDNEHGREVGIGSLLSCAMTRSWEVTSHAVNVDDFRCMISVLYEQK